MLNDCVIMGRLTRDPEVRLTTGETKVASFCVAVDRDFKPKDGAEREADFINCVAWRNTADFLGNYFHKGNMIVVKGRLQSRSYDKDGEKRYITELVADNVYFGEGKKSDSAQPAGSALDDLQNHFPSTVKFSEIDAASGDLPF